MGWTFETAPQPLSLILARSSPDLIFLTENLGIYKGENEENVF